MLKQKFPWITGISLVLIFVLVALAIPQGLSAQDDSERVNNRRLRLSFHVGATYPLGIGSNTKEDVEFPGVNLDDLADSNVHFRFDFTYQLNDKLDLVAFLGFSQFTDDYAAFVHYYTFNTSINLKFLMPTSTGLKWYLQWGPGVYIPKNGLALPYPTGNTLGFNVGFGAQVPLPGPFDIEWGVDLHNVNIASNAQPRYWFLTFQLGVLFR
ncbi:MAG: porin family protein [bacterium]|nr:porin family protein [bacterium]